MRSKSTTGREQQIAANRRSWRGAANEPKFDAAAWLRKARRILDEREAGKGVR